MKTWLRNEEFVPHASDIPGKTVHIHHCKTGFKNDRLYITRKEDDTIVAFCHHCGARGNYNVASSGTVSRTKRTQTYASLDKDYACAPDTDLNLRSEDIDRMFRESWTSESRRRLALWPAEAKRWWLGCGLTIPEQEAHGVTYNDKEHTVDIPILSRGIAVGMCMRTFAGGEHTPKYILLGERVAQPIIHKSGRISAQPLVIVEDFRSAIKVARVANSYPLLGTQLQDTQIIKILEAKASKVLIYLDNDNAQVKRQASLMKNRLNIYLPTDIISVENDPKNLSEDELRELIS